MLRRVDIEESLADLRPPGVPAEAAVPPVAEAELETALLPHDHPKWVRDAVAISQRARELIERLKPIVVRVLTVWDHRFRCIAIGSQRLSVDASGSYRID